MKDESVQIYEPIIHQKRERLQIMIIANNIDDRSCSISNHIILYLPFLSIRKYNMFLFLASVTETNNNMDVFGIEHEYKKFQFLCNLVSFEERYFTVGLRLLGHHTASI